MRKEFSRATKRAALARSEKRCEVEVYADTFIPVDIRNPRRGVRTRRCMAPLDTGLTFDHIDPDASGGGNDLDNCQCACSVCNKIKTNLYDLTQIARDLRLRDKAQGITKPKGRPMPGTKASGFRKRMDGTVVRRK